MKYEKFRYEQTNFDPKSYKTWSSTSSTFKDAEDYIWFVKKTFESDFFKNSDVFKNDYFDNFNQKNQTYQTTQTKQSKIEIVIVMKFFKIIQHNLTITFLEACLGTTKTIQTRFCYHCNGSGTKGFNEIICSNCDGRGNVINYYFFNILQVRVTQGPIHMVIPCPTCNRYGKVKKAILCTNCDGHGKFVIPKKFNFKIPAGI